MLHLNQNYLKLPKNYLFAEIAQRVEAYQKAHPDADIIRLGIGDVTQPIPRVIAEALSDCALKMTQSEFFKGYGPYEGYAFLREKIAAYYATQGVVVDPDAIFVNDGAKADTASIIDIFQVEKIAVCDPVYPVYIDSNALAGNLGTLDSNTGKWEKVVYMPCTEENNFVPALPTEPVDLIYLCFPNNPTGSMISLEKLQQFVDFANQTGAIILYDGAYEAYITQDYPHSIYACKGAKTCAIEFRSLSKDAGFTGLRSGYTVIPKELVRDNLSLHDLWMRRQATKYNGASVLIQHGAAARFTLAGQEAVQQLISFYQENARLILQGFQQIGWHVFGGVNAPYIWLKTPDHLSSWDFFDYLLNTVQIVGTPGSGFGPAGEGYFRLTAFGSREKTLQAIERLKKQYG